MISYSLTSSTDQRPESSTMTSKILVLVLFVATASCQQDEDDGSYNPEKYEKPYENLVNEPSSASEFNSNQIPTAFQESQQIQQVQPQQVPLFQQAQNAPASAPAEVQNPFPQNPFLRRLQNSVQSQQQQQQQQFPTFQQQNAVPQAQVFQQNPASQNSQQFQQNPASQTPQQFQQPTPFQLQQTSNSFRQPAPVNQFLDDGAPLQSTNYQTDDGHQRSEVVDSDGNVQGQYSYVDPNGKTITVKYSAGKDGFQVEGDHIPRSSQPVVEQQPQQPLFNQPISNLPQNNIQFRPQQPRFNSPLQQFFSPIQARSQFSGFQQQFARPQLSQQSPQFDRQDAFSFQPDGTYELQSSFQ